MAQICGVSSLGVGVVGWGVWVEDSLGGSRIEVEGECAEEDPLNHPSSWPGAWLGYHLHCLLQVDQWVILQVFPLLFFSLNPLCRLELSGGGEMLPLRLAEWLKWAGSALLGPSVIEAGLGQGADFVLLQAALWRILPGPGSAMTQQF